MWTYYGVHVSPADCNSAGMRWESFTSKGRMRADTKDGMRWLIRETVPNLRPRRTR
jgi:hypothetical protein